MRKFLFALTVVIGLLAASCGDDSATDAGNDDPPTTDPSDDSTDGDSDDSDSGGDSDDSDSDGSDSNNGDDGPILGAGPYPIADLTITVTLTDGADATTSRLACLGDTATVTGDPGPAAANTMCLALNDPSIKDRIVNGAPTDVACTEQYGGPEIATISGTLDGVEVDTTFDRANGCGIGDWQLLSTFLPAPI